jgi:ComF family protein
MQSLLNIFLKPNCPLCGRSTLKIICIDCDRQISDCKSSNFYQDLGEINLFGWGDYDGSLKQAIATCKFENHPELAQPLGIKIGEAWNQDLEAQNLVKHSRNLRVVPIPMHAGKLKTRGFNQAELLAQNFCNLTRLAIASRILNRVKNTRPQIETKSKQERKDNLSSAFTIGKIPHKNISVLLFDDIYTSGATVKEAIATLKSANIQVVGVVVLATPKFKQISKGL